MPPRLPNKVIGGRLALTLVAHPSVASAASRTAS